MKLEINKYYLATNIIYFFMLVLMVVTPVCANSTNDEIELGGLVIDQTITIKGRQFYLAFSTSWSSSHKAALSGFICIPDGVFSGLRVGQDFLVFLQATHYSWSGTSF